MSRSILGLTIISAVLLNLGFPALAQDNEVLARCEIPHALELSDQGQNTLPIPASKLKQLTASDPNASVILEFQDLSTNKPVGTYFEVYLVAKDAGSDQATGHYVGNLDFYGISEATAGDARVKSIDVTKVYRDINFGENGVAVMLRAAAPDAEHAKPKLGGIEFQVVDFQS